MEKGPAARGEAGVFGGSINPLQIYFQQNAAKQKAHADLVKEYRDKRDAYLDDLSKWAPDKVWDDMYDVMNSRLQDFRDQTRAQINANGGIVNERVKRDVQRGQGDVNEVVAKANGLKDLFNKSLGEIDQNPLLNKQAARTKLYDLKDQWHHALSTGASPDTDMDYHFKNDPTLLNEGAVIMDFMKNKPVLLRSTYGQMMDNEGRYLTDGQLESKLDYEMEEDPKTHLKHPKIDPETLAPIPIINDAWYTLAKAHPETRLLMESYGGQSQQEQKDWLKTKLPGYDPRKDKVSITTGFKFDKDNNPANFFNGINFGRPVTEIENRRDWLDKITTGYHPDLLASVGNVTKDIKAEYVLGADKKPTGITITYPTGVSDSELDIKDPDFAAKYLAKGGKKLETVTLDISTEQKKKAARHKLSEIIDSQLKDSKQAIGTDKYVQYEDAYYKSKRPKKGAADDL